MDFNDVKLESVTMGQIEPLFRSFFQAGLETGISLDKDMLTTNPKIKEIIASKAYEAVIGLAQAVMTPMLQEDTSFEDGSMV